MSSYLHFGQISPVTIALRAMERSPGHVESYLEELIVRQELAVNFVYYNKDYDNIGCLPNWAKRTIYEHSLDEREYNYDLEELQNGKSHDPYWNAA